MIASFVRPDQPEDIVAQATWVGPGVEIEAGDEATGDAMARVFRPIPAVVDDPALRTAGTSGPVLLSPGSLRWFLAAARARSEAEGLSVSFSPAGRGALGWDPAGSYRTFADQVERLERRPSTT
jgi:hypothetical protein